MWHRFFSKFIIKVREQVVADLGLNLPARSYEEHLDDFLTMLIRMAGTLLVAFAVAFYHGVIVINILRWPFRSLLEKQPIYLDGFDCSDHGLLSSGWELLALVLSFLALGAYRHRTRLKLNFK